MASQPGLLNSKELLDRDWDEVTTPATSWALASFYPSGVLEVCRGPGCICWLSALSWLHWAGILHHVAPPRPACVLPAALHAGLVALDWQD
jgi:hypothetical protein